jgi:hypothetical protein
MKIIFVLFGPALEHALLSLMCKNTVKRAAIYVTFKNIIKAYRINIYSRHYME